MKNKNILHFFNTMSSGKVIESKYTKSLFQPINRLSLYSLGAKELFFSLTITIINLPLDGTVHIFMLVKLNCERGNTWVNHP